MTLHDRLKGIPVEFNTTETGRLVLSDSTISAIIAAFTERLPEGKERIEWHHLVDSYYRNGWNAYRQEVRKVLGEKL